MGLAWILDTETRSPTPSGVDPFEEATVTHLDELEVMLRRYPELHLRYSEGPIPDSRAGSVDAESGLPLPGLSAAPLEPERWWHRPLADWIARQIHHARRLIAPARSGFPWVLTGRVAGRGPDGEPLLVNTVPVARLSESVLLEARDRYRAHFEAHWEARGVR